MVRRLLAAALGLAFAVTPLVSAAQSDTGEIHIVVQDASSKSAVVLARVMLDGPVVTSEFTDGSGRVIFTDVPDGIYRARVFARGFSGVTSSNFEVTDGHVVTVTVALAQASGGPLRTIASENVKSTATVSTNSITDQSAQRKLSDNLADALGKLSGVSVTTSSNDSDATQTVSLEGQDSSQTQMTLDGIPMNAPGTSGDMRMIGGDLFTGANVNFGPTLGGLAGGVNFRTLEPTLSWQSAFTLSAGSNGKNNYSFGESGSLGNLGVAFMHTYRMNPSLLDGMQYLDASGLDYTHEGDRQQVGTMAKLRYQLGQAQTITGTFIDSTNGSQLVCTQYTGKLPCGYGPGNSYNTNFQMYSLMDDALIGDTNLQASFFGSRGSMLHDLLDRYIGGVAEPTGTQSTNSMGGFMLNATLPAQQRHTISISAYGENSTSAFTPLVPQAAPYTFPGQQASYDSLSLNDSIRSNTKLRLTDSIGISRSSNAGASLLAGAGANWQPDADDSYAFTYNLGGNAAHAGRFGILTDPASLQFDCNGDVAFGSAPGDQPGPSSSNSARLSYTRRGNWGVVSAQVYSQVQHDVVLPVDVNGTALLALFPSGYFSSASSAYDTTCGLPPATQLQPSQTYFSTPIGNVSRTYEGMHLNGFFNIGRLVVGPYYDVQVAKAFSGDPRFNNPYAITVGGAQLPNVPLHRAGVTLDYKAPHSLIEWLADANYTGNNNPQNLPAYTTVDAGASMQLKRGSLTVALSNVFNADAGIFATPQGAVPYVTANGTLIPTIARPNTPHQISVTYTARFGQGAAAAAQQPQGPPGENAPVIRGRGGFMRMFEPLPQSAPSDPFAIRESPICTADAQKQAQPVLAGLKAYAAQIEAAKTSAGYPQTMPAPDIPGVSVTYHGLQSTYALSIAVKQTAQLRPLFGCAQLHIAGMQTVQQRKLYVNPDSGGGMFFRPEATFMPSVGLYFVPRPPQAGQASFRLYKLPSAPPAAPFAIASKAPTCTAEMKSTAQQMLAQLQAHFANGATAPGWTITPHTASAGTWYALEAVDVATVPAILNCGHVAVANKDDLTKLGWDGSPPPQLSYTPALGIYLLMPQMREVPLGGPRPQPSASP
jgi:hypothetical protein